MQPNRMMLSHSDKKAISFETPKISKVFFNLLHGSWQVQRNRKISEGIENS